MNVSGFSRRRRSVSCRENRACVARRPGPSAPGDRNPPSPPRNWPRHGPFRTIPEYPPPAWDSACWWDKGSARPSNRPPSPAGRYVPHSDPPARGKGPDPDGFQGGKNHYGPLKLVFQMGSVNQHKLVEAHRQIQMLFKIVISWEVFRFSPISPMPRTLGRSMNSGISFITSARKPRPAPPWD